MNWFAYQFPRQTTTQHNIWFSKIVIIQLKYILDSFVFQIFKTTHLFVVGCHTKYIFTLKFNYFCVSDLFCKMNSTAVSCKKSKIQYLRRIVCPMIKMGQGVPCSQAWWSPKSNLFFWKKNKVSLETTVKKQKMKILFSRFSSPKRHHHTL